MKRNMGEKWSGSDHGTSSSIGSIDSGARYSDQLEDDTSYDYADNKNTESFERMVANSAASSR
jgi:hypothetical protein